MSEYIGDWEFVPSLILARIFEFVGSGEERLQDLFIASKVCRRWRDMSKNPTLWRLLDLTGPRIKKVESTIQVMISGRDMSQLRSIDFGGWSLLTNNGLQLLADQCPRIQCIGLSRTQVNNVGIVYLVMKCLELNGVDLSSMKSDAPDGSGMTYLLQNRGGKIRSLNLSSNLLRNFNSTLHVISTNCSQLRMLDLSDIRFPSDDVTFNIEVMQNGCSKLEVLRLSDTPFRIGYASPKDQRESPGFPHLEELAMGVDEGKQGLDGPAEALVRIVKSSFGLKSLNVSGCPNITWQILKGLNLPDLERLLIANSKSATYEGINGIMGKWIHSLVELDISSNFYPATSVISVLNRMAVDPERTRLEILSIRRTQTSLGAVHELLKAFPRLVSLDLRCCAGLPRNSSRLHVGPDLAQLRIAAAAAAVAAGAHN